MDKLVMQRRDAIKSLLAISAAGALAACRGSTESIEGKSSSSTSLKYASEGKFFGAKELALLTALGDTIIPKTETAGAGEAGIADTLQQLVSNWADDDFKRYWRGGLNNLDTVFLKRGGQKFEAHSAKQRENILAKYDSEVFGGAVENDFYRDMKRTIATAYYMSEVGATEELNYDPVPGEWRADVPFSDIGKAWAT
jgi:hypothetical protein